MMMMMMIVNGISFISTVNGTVFYIIHCIVLSFCRAKCDIKMDFMKDGFLVLLKHKTEMRRHDLAILTYRL